MSNKLKFLVVDDDPVDTRAVCRILDRSGVSGYTDTASSLAQAKQKVRGRHYDAVILDLGLPDSQGIDGIIDFHASAPELPIVVLTGNEDEETALRSLDLGAEDFLSKNAINDDALCHSLRFAIERHRRKGQVYRDLDVLRSSLKDAELKASTDPLTSLPNRRGLQRYLEHLALAHPGSPVVVGVSDIDYFKQVNDTFGHNAGDVVLREFSARLQHSLRGTDFAARVGGDEFVIVFAGLGRSEALQMGRKLVKRVSSEPVHEGGREIPFSCTLALAELQPPFLDLEQVLLKTHAVLARGKQGGRDRVECEWEPSGGPAEGDDAQVALPGEALDFGESRLLQLTRKIHPVGTTAVLGQHLAFGLGPQPWPMVTPAVNQARLAKQLPQMTLHCLKRAADWMQANSPGMVLHADVEADAVRPDFCARLGDIFPQEKERVNCVLFFHTDFQTRRGAIALTELRLLRQMGFQLGARSVGDGSTILEHLQHLQPDWIRFEAPMTLGLSRFKKKEDDLVQLLKMLDPLRALLLAEDAEDEDLPRLEQLGFHAHYGKATWPQAPAAE